MIQLLALTTLAAAAGVAAYAIAATVAPRFDRILAALRGRPPLPPIRAIPARGAPRRLPRARQGA